MDHKFTLKANKFQAGLDKPHEHVIDLKVEMKFGRDVIKKKMSLRLRAGYTSGRLELLVRLLVIFECQYIGGKTRGTEASDSDSHRPCPFHCPELDIQRGLELLWVSYKMHKKF